MMNKHIHIDLESISEEIGIEKDALLELLNIYISEISQEILKAKELLIRKDWAGLQRSIHTIKGVSANLFIETMHEAAAAIDQKLKAMDLENIAANVEELIGIYDAVEIEIECILKQH